MSGKTETAMRFTTDNEEIFQLCNVLDKYEIARNKGYMTNTGFISERVQLLADRMLEHIGADRREYIFDGGYGGALRKMLIFPPDRMSSETVISSENSPLAFVRISYYREYSLSHRDILGAILGSGVSRSAVGDILVNGAEHRADMIISAAILPWTLESFTSAGRATLRVDEISRELLFVPEQKTALTKDTVASLRLDGIISSALGISREKASSAVSKGQVEVDHFPCQRGEKQLGEGAVVSVRGYGKFVLESVGERSKKGRIFISIKRYL